MLRLFVESLGGNFATSADLSDLDGTDLLILFHPDRPWPKAARDQLDQFVRDGGSLLVVADPEIRDGNSLSSFNDVLESTAMRVSSRYGHGSRAQLGAVMHGAGPSGNHRHQRPQEPVSGCPTARRSTFACRRVPC